MRKTKLIFPLLFAAFVLVMTAGLGLNALRDLGVRGTVREMVSGLRNADPGGWETRVNESLDRDHVFINIFGAVQRAMGKDYVDDSAGNPVARLSTGQLTFATLTEMVDQTGHAKAVLRLRDELKDIPLALVIAPTKLSNPAAKMPQGLPDYGNALADSLMELLEGEIDILDLRPDFVAADPDNSWFYTTDHHWRAEGAFFSVGTLMDFLHRTYGFPVNAQALDPDQYDAAVLEDIFLGSQGKRVGLYYAGVDDYTVISPRFETRFEYYCGDDPTPRVGTMNEALCFDQFLEKDYFNNNPQTYYAGYDWDKCDARNLLNPDGPTVVLIRDSFASNVIPFLAIQAGRVVSYDLRAFEGNLLSELRELDPDCVLLFYGASSVKSDTSFDFFG